MSGSYYNEFEPYAAEWLRNLIKKGLIADGKVDDRSIVDVRSNDLRGFTQCHFFAGIGVWSHALRLAGWADDRAVWTGSCPCQPFSAAGKGKGVEDERHLWPEFHRLISECRPPVVFGEQVASKDGLGWLDAVCADMEASGYAIGAADLCAAGIGAPHIRQRLWFVGERLADADSEDQRGRGIQRPGQGNGPCDGSARERLAGLRADGGLGDQHHQGLEGQRGGHQAEEGRLGAVRPVAASGEPRGLADADSERHERWAASTGCEARADTGLAGRSEDSGMADASGERRYGQQVRLQSGQQEQASSETAWHGSNCRPSPADGHWRDADWLHCRDGKWRPVEPGTFPLAHGAPARVGRLRGYGNAINAEAAIAFIQAYLEADAGLTIEEMLA